MKHANIFFVLVIITLGNVGMEYPRWQCWNRYNNNEIEESFCEYKTLRDAVQSKELCSIKHYLENHPACNANEPDEKGNTILHKLIKTGDITIAHFFITYAHASLDRLNNKGQTPKSLTITKNCYGLLVPWRPD